MKNKGHTHCSICGKKLNEKDIENNLGFDKVIGFGSKYRFKHINFNLCTDCFDKVMDNIVFNSKTNIIEESKGLLSGDCKPIYTMATFEKLETNKRGRPEIGDERTIGFFHEFNNAEDTIVNNCCDIYEGCYGYAIIEEVIPGEYPNSRKRWLYKYNREKDKYERIDEPECLKPFISITMG